MNPFPPRGAHVDQLIGAYALDALDDVERATVERHLRTCPVCADEAAELLETTARLGSAAATGAPPAALRDRVLAAARVTPQRVGRRTPAPPRSGLRRIVAAAAAVLVLAGAVGGTWWAQQQRVEHERSRVLAAERETGFLRSILTAPDASLRVATDTPTGRVTAVYSASQRAAVFSFTGLTSVPAGKTYQLWRITAGTPSSLRVLPVGQVAGSVPVRDLAGGDVLAISVENVGGARAPTDVYTTLSVA